MTDFLNGLASKFSQVAQDGTHDQADPQEAGQLVQSYAQSTPADQQQSTYRDFVRTLSPEQRASLAKAINDHPDVPVQDADPQSDDSMAQAIHRTATAPVNPQSGESPLQQVFGPGGALSNPWVKAGLVGLAGIVGSSLINRR